MSASEHGTPAMYRAELRLDGKTCAACRAAHCAANRANAARNRRRRAPAVRRVGRPATRRDEVMAEWEFWRSYIPFDSFPEKVGMTLRAWQLMFRRAIDAGDPRAVRHQSSGRRVA